VATAAVVGQRATEGVHRAAKEETMGNRDGGDNRDGESREKVREGREERLKQDRRL
jgi:hypothetical protein